MQKLPEVNSILDLPDGGQAVLKYIGSIDQKEGVFCGIELLGSLSYKGKNSGAVNGVQYFEVESPNSGLFIPLRKLQSWLNNSTMSVSPISTQPPMMKSLERDPKLIIDIYQNRIMKSELDLKEMSIQLDELDSDLKRKEELWLKREEKFDRFKADKELEIDQLMITINLLQQKVTESEEKFKQLNTNRSQDSSDNLMIELQKEKEKFSIFKIEKSKEVNELRAFEMKNFKLQMELEKLKEGSNAVEDLKKENSELKNENEEMKKELSQLKLQLHQDVGKVQRNSNNDEINKWIDKNGSLKIFTPSKEIDPSDGNPNFCTFCDREGHSTADCPYENDNLDQF